TTPTGGGERIGYEDYLDRLLTTVTPLPARRVAVGPQAVGLVTADPVRAVLPAPAFTNSAMDGFALRDADLAGRATGQEARLEVSADIPAGVPAPPWRPGTAVRIMTGAP